MGGNELITKGSERVRDQAIELEQTWYALVGGQDIYDAMGREGQSISETGGRGGAKQI